MECAFQTAHEEAAWLSAPRAAEVTIMMMTTQTAGIGKGTESDRVAHGVETARKSQMVSSALPKW